MSRLRRATRVEILAAAGAAFDAARADDFFRGEFSTTDETLVFARVYRTLRDCEGLRSECVLDPHAPGGKG